MVQEVKAVVMVVYLEVAVGEQGGEAEAQKCCR